MKKNKMEKEFVPYELSLKLKELGFDEPCFGKYLSNLQSDWKKFELILEMGMNEEFEDNRNIYLLEEACSAPTFSQAFRWFREKYNLRGFIGFRPNVKQFDCHIYDMSLSGEEYVKQRTMEEYNKDPKVGTYEEAELACLAKLIELIEK